MRRKHFLAIEDCRHGKRTCPKGEELQELLAACFKRLHRAPQKTQEQQMYCTVHFAHTQCLHSLDSGTGTGHRHNAPADAPRQAYAGESAAWESCWVKEGQVKGATRVEGPPG